VRVHLILLLPLPTCKAYPIAILLHAHCAIYSHQPTPLFMPYTIHYWRWQYRVRPNSAVADVVAVLVEGERAPLAGGRAPHTTTQITRFATYTRTHSTRYARIQIVVRLSRRRCSRRSGRKRACPSCRRPRARGPLLSRRPPRASPGRAGQPPQLTKRGKGGLELI